MNRAFRIRMGQPEMESFWMDLLARKRLEKLNRDEDKFFTRLVKALDFLSLNPRHNSLSTHEISDLSRKYGMKIFQSYLENHTPRAGRIFWAYGHDVGDITILAIEPYPEDKRGAYERIQLSAMPRTAIPSKKKR